MIVAALDNQICQTGLTTYKSGLGSGCRRSGFVFLFGFSLFPLRMKTLLILLALASTFGATLGLPSTFLGFRNYPGGPFDPFDGRVRRIRDTNFIDIDDEQFSEEFRDYDKSRDGKGRFTYDVRGGWGKQSPKKQTK